MLSIIICSISPDALKQVMSNIDDTVGIEHEILAFDNRKYAWPISKVYNSMAAQAKFPCLLFVHEDVVFHQEGWGSVFVEKMKEPDCGIIGYAGTKVMRNRYSGWYQNRSWQCMVLYQGKPDGTSVLTVENVTREPFEEVVAVDGFAMAMRRDVWDEYRFDEENLKGFHCYDVDICLRVAADSRYRNYVCTTRKALVEHRSYGNFASAWYDETIRIYHLRWKHLLPLQVEGYPLDRKNIGKIDEHISVYFIRRAVMCDYAKSWQLVKEYISSPRSPFIKYLCNSVYLLYLLIINRFRR